eukprot:24620-Pelagococcus_subviridis.AAC.1
MPVRREDGVAHDRVPDRAHPLRSTRDDRLLDRPTPEGRGSIRSDVGVELKGVRGGVERRR